jgi:hypothetical protein
MKRQRSVKSVGHTRETTLPPRDSHSSALVLNFAIKSTLGVETPEGTLDGRLLLGVAELDEVGLNGTACRLSTRAADPRHYLSLCREVFPRARFPSSPSLELLLSVVCLRQMTSPAPPRSSSRNSVNLTLVPRLSTLGPTAMFPSVASISHPRPLHPDVPCCLCALL